MYVKSVFAAIAATFVLAAAPSHATLITFNFDAVQPHDNTAEGNGLGKTGGNTEVAAYMNAVIDAALGAGSESVAVAGALATSTYNGEGHVNGDSLGTSNGGVHNASSATDGFIINDNFGVYGSASDRFSFTFSNFYIYSISFDWQIFPDATCVAGSACAGNPSNANYPDIELLADGTSVWSQLATTPPQGAAHRDPQALGHLSTIALNGVSKLTFVDWPAEVGIDNLVIEGCSTRTACFSPDQPVPEPGIGYLLAASLMAFGASRRLRGRAAPSRA